MTKSSAGNGDDRNVVELDKRRTDSAPPMSREASAFWTFLGTTLIGPFLAAVVIFLASLASGFVFGRGPASLLALDPSGKLAWSAMKAVETYVWCAVPAGIAGAVAAGTVYLTGTLHWLAAASIGAVVASALAFAAGGMLGAHVTPIAFIAATVGVALQMLFRKARIFS